MTVALVDHTQRSMLDEQVWSAQWSLVPDYSEWLQYFRDDTQNLRSRNFIDLDPQRYGRVQVVRRVFDLKNGGMVRVTDRQFMRQSHTEVRVNFDGLVAGLEPAAQRDEFTKLTRKELVERDLTPEEIEIHNPILKDKKKKRTKEEDEALIKTIKEEKEFEDQVYVPPSHSNLFISFDNATRVFIENERVADLQQIQDQAITVSSPIDTIFGIQATVYRYAAVATLSFQCGVTFKSLPGGDVMLKHFEKGLTGAEQYRVVTAAGTVVSFLEDGRREVMLANGNLCLFDGKGSWTTTNNKGLRKRLDISTGEEEELLPVPAVTKSNSVTSRYPVCCFREDGTKTFIYESGDRLTSFKDGTRIFLSENRNTTIVESPNLPTVFAYRGKPIHTPYKREFAVEPMIREQSFDGSYREVVLPDRSTAFVWEDRSGYTSMLLESVDGSVVKMSSSGECVLVPSAVRWSLSDLAEEKDKLQAKREIITSRADQIEDNVEQMLETMSNLSKAPTRVGQKKMTKKQAREERDKEEKKLEEYRANALDELRRDVLSLNDKLYREHSSTDSYVLEQLDLDVAMRGCGVITFDINQKCASTVDIEGRQLVVADDGSFTVNDTVRYDDARLRNFYDLYGQPTPFQLKPQLFAVFPDGRAYQYLSRGLVQHFVKQTEFDHLWRVEVARPVAGYSQAKSVTSLRQCESQQFIMANHREILAARPNSAESELLEKLFGDRKKKSDPNGYFLFRQLYIFPESSSEADQSFDATRQAHSNWHVKDATSQRLGVPGTGQDEKREIAALINRQQEFTYENRDEKIINSMSDVKRVIAEEEQEDRDRIKTRMQQMQFEDTIRNRQKADPYSVTNDENFKAVAAMMLHMHEYKLARYQDDRLKAICNKFVNNYFYTVSGIEFSRNNPSDNYVKPQFDRETLKELQELGKQTLEEQRQATNANRLRVSSEADQKASKDRREAPTHLGQSGKGRDFRIKSKPLQSIVKQMEQERLIEEERDRRKTQEYLSKLKYDVDIYGKQRAPLPAIYSMFRGHPQYELNEKTIEIEAPTDKRIKTSSMADRVYLHAPSTDEIRNEGMHQTLMRSMDKGYSHKYLLERKKLMPIAVKADPLERDFVIYPHKIDFGTIRPGNCYKTDVLIINDNYFLQRVKVIGASDKNIKVVLSKAGPIAMGQDRRITVYLDAENIDQTEVETEFYIMSKYRKYTIPVTAMVAPNTDSDQASPSMLRRSTLAKAEANKMQGLLEIKKVQREEMDVIKTHTSGRHLLNPGDGTGTITQDYLNDIVYDKAYEIKTDLPLADLRKGQTGKRTKAAINYDDDENSENEEEEQFGTLKTGRS